MRVVSHHSPQNSTLKSLFRTPYINFLTWIYLTDRTIHHVLCFALCLVFISKCKSQITISIYITSQVPISIFLDGQDGRKNMARLPQWRNCTTLPDVPAFVAFTCRNNKQRIISKQLWPWSVNAKCKIRAFCSKRE